MTTKYQPRYGGRVLQLYPDDPYPLWARETIERIDPLQPLPDDLVRQHRILFEEFGPLHKLNCIDHPKYVENFDCVWNFQKALSLHAHTVYHGGWMTASWHWVGGVRSWSVWDIRYSAKQELWRACSNHPLAGVWFNPFPDNYITYAAHLNVRDKDLHYDMIIHHAHLTEAVIVIDSLAALVADGINPWPLY